MAQCPHGNCNAYFRTFPHFVEAYQEATALHLTQAVERLEGAWSPAWVASLHVKGAAEKGVCAGNSVSSLV